MLMASTPLKEKNFLTLDALEYISTFMPMASTIIKKDNSHHKS